MTIILDTSAWIEFFIKSKKGELVKEILKKGECYTSIVSISEISNWALRENKDGKEITEFVIKTTEIININNEISFLAGELNFKRKKKVKNWGMLDSFILATALIYSFTILTKDSHFKDLENVHIL